MINYSIIICTYNRCNYLKETIISILDVLQKRDDYEILVIDNNSTDDTQKVLNEFTSVNELKNIFELNQGLSHARNRGIAEANGKILVFLDDDIEMGPNYFTICDKIFAQSEISIVGGKVLPHNITIPEWLPVKYHYLASVFDLGNKSMYVKHVMGANYSMRKDVVAKVGLYNVNLGRKENSLMAGEETNYFDRAKILGYNIYYSPNLIVYHKINNKLNKDYIYNYAYQSGLSQKISDKHSAKTTVIYISTIKSIIAQLLFHATKYLKLKPATKSYLEIIQSYGMGYIKSK